MLKVLGWVVVVLVLMFAVLVGVSYYLGSESIETHGEGEEFGKSASRDECLYEVADRVAECTGARCLLPTITFGSSCFGTASGDITNYCEGKRIKTLPKDYCAEYPDSQYCNQAVAGVVSAYCEEDGT